MRNRLWKMSVVGVCLLLSLSSCVFSKKKGWEPPQRVKLVLPEKFRVEYQNISEIFSSDSQVRSPGYCTVVKDGNLYYTKVPTVFSSDRLEVMRKGDLNTPVIFDSEEYAQGFISASWQGDAWLTADKDDATPNAGHWHANDKNNHVYYVAIAFLDHGYGSINHIYDNGIENTNGSKHTATQLADATLVVGDNSVECVVWEYEAYFSEENWSREKYWLEKDSNIVLKKNSIYPTSAVSDIDDDANTNFKATYFSKGDDVSMGTYLESIERSPAPDFSQYN